ncbi:hypothetical protein BCR34DRAFT_587877 [Clohesyomyces aquaticus]|uniref:Tim44-like domain-containing protein n=1 Tax=Clohesyomyces aquaticus TaxID=1231657 RepID=A0A1Y1ZMR1_9PLEO|nr:hypothetical protein BCR34DRAFT_587877 [Clohesyomyces aquaticus]
MTVADVAYYRRSRYKWWIKKGPWRAKPKLARGPIKKDAKVLYETLWKAFAQKDEEQLSEICCSSIMEPLRGQWAARPPNHVVSWKLEKHHLRSPRVVSNKAQDIALANFAESALRQVVIRFKTRQTITTRILPKDMREDGEDGDGWVKNPVERSADKEYRYKWTPAGPKDVTEKSEEDEVKTTSKTVDVVEYMIVQRIMKRGVEGEWKVYGFAQPTTLESIAENDEHIRKSEAFMNAHPEFMDG